MSDDDPQPIPRKKGSKRSGPSMREQIAARRRAETEGGAAPAKPAAKASAKPAEAAKPMPKRAQRSAPAKAPAKAAAKPAAEAEAKESRPTPTRRSSGGSRSSARRAGGGRSRRSGGEDDEEEGGGSGRARRGRAPQKKKSPLPMVAGGVLVVALAGGGWYAMNSGNDAEAAETESTADAGNDAGADTAGDGAATETNTDTAPSAAEDTAAEDTAADDTAAGDAAAGAAAAAETATDEAAAANAPDAGAAAETTPEEKPATKPKPSSNIPTGVREGFDPNQTGTQGLSIEELMLMVKTRAERTPYAKPDDVDADTWSSAQEDAAEMRAGGGASVARAGKRLADAQKAGYVALLNELIQMDFADAEQFANAKSMTDAMNKARGSDNKFGYGWRDSMRSELPADADIRFNLKVLVQIYDLWTKAVEDPNLWETKIWLGDEYESDRERTNKKLNEELDGGGDSGGDDGEVSDDEFDFGE